MSTINKYQLNIHAHSKFSDGSHSPIDMAIEAKALGLSALVLTDHYYGGLFPKLEINVHKLKDYNQAIIEARTILPVIRGLEVAFRGEEFLLFGSSAINWLLTNNGLNTSQDVKKMKSEHNCAIVLCHPGDDYHEWIDILDGYERHNQGTDYFADRELGELEKLQAWHNSDAHCKEVLSIGYNLLPVEIKDEESLIDYIKSGKQHDHFINPYFSWNIK